jgi:formylglycine-generating enzyme required for sulfatase activity
MRRNRHLAYLALFATAALSVSGVRAQVQGEREFQECADCPAMVGIPGGSFLMGSPEQEPGRFDTEGPVHAVDVTAFALGKYPVTSKEFLIFLRETGYQPAPCNPILRLSWRSPGNGLAYPPIGVEPPKWPAVCLDWNDANAYLDWLNAKVRQERPQLSGRPGPYRLPSEAEWEYAARGGTATARWWGETIGNGNANCNGCGSRYDYRTLADVDSFALNPFGLYGVLGNAWQWTADCWHESYAGAPADGSAWLTGDCSKHVLRGGAYNNVPIFIRSATRSGGAPNGREFDYSSLAGFRVARTLP